MRQFMAMTKALADEKRVRMLMTLQERELCLCQIAGLLALALSTTSQHMSVLRRAGLVEGRKEGRWMYYRWPGPDASPAVRQALRWAQESLTDAPRVQRDRERLREILQTPRQRLCEGPRQASSSQKRS